MFHANRLKCVLYLKYYNLKFCLNLTILFNLRLSSLLSSKSSIACLVSAKVSPGMKWLLVLDDIVALRAVADVIPALANIRLVS